MAQQGASLEYDLGDGVTRTVDLLPGELWTFGRSKECSATLVLPALSRTALLVQHLEQGVVRVVSRQSNRGRVVIDSDDRAERHELGLGSGPVHLTRGNYQLKVELPPIVLRMQIAVPPAMQQAPPATRHGVHAHETTVLAWTPFPGEPEEQSWIAVAALSVTLASDPELSASGPASGAAPASSSRLSDALRSATGLWCGHASTYWVNERLKEAALAADLAVPEHGQRLAAVVAHYEQFFSDAAIRTVRDELIRLREVAASSDGPG